MPSDGTNLLLFSIFTIYLTISTLFGHKNIGIGLAFTDTVSFSIPFLGHCVLRRNRRICMASSCSLSPVMLVAAGQLHTAGAKGGRRRKEGLCYSSSVQRATARRIGCNLNCGGNGATPCTPDWIARDCFRGCSLHFFHLVEPFFTPISFTSDYLTPWSTLYIRTG